MFASACLAAVAFELKTNKQPFQNQFPDFDQSLQVDLSFFLSHTKIIYHHQQNKLYPQRCLLVDFKSTLDFNRSEFTCP